MEADISPYRAPLRDLAFVIRELAGLDAVAQLPGNTEATPDLVEAVLDEAAAFASGVLEPLDAAGDREGARWHDGGVSMPAGFTAAYRQFADAGWIGLPFPPEYGGQGLPMLVGAAVLEMWSAANLGFANGPDLNAGAIEALLLCGSPEQKQLYVPRLISGQWTGTMVLTEPQAGSDLAAVRTLAVPDGDHYRISGQKIFITYGEHDMAENIVHLVLARTPTAPPGVKGISLFIVPKFVVNADGTLGKRNDVYCASIEHKLGIRASPTCVLNYGESGGAIGYLVGEENRGLEYMFVMMNRARFAVGVQGLGQADRAYQRALAYALERVQGKSVASRDPSPVAIVHHPDVRRMLMTMKSQIEAMRALALVVAAALDHAHNDPDPAIRAEEQAFSELMTPIVKGWLTETSLEIVSTAVQVHGGMGFIEESGAPQSYRDARITAIYEGTTAIQANALVGRKLLRDQGQTVVATIARMRALDAKLAESSDPDVVVVRTALTRGVDALDEASRSIRAAASDDVRIAYAGSVPYLMLWGIVAGGWQLARAALAAERGIAAGAADADFYRAKLATARYYATHILSRAAWLREEIVAGSADVMRLDPSELALDRVRLSAVGR